MSDNTYKFLRHIAVFAACVFAGYLFHGRVGAAWGIVIGILFGLT